MYYLSKWQRTTIFMICCLVILFLAGCGDKFWDPTQIGRFRPKPAINVILDSLGVAEETVAVWEGAEEPKPSDIIAYDTDYVFGPGDVARISIYELRQSGVPYINDYVVTETGKISIPDVGIVEAQGLTESQLEDEIAQILSPNILKDPSVTVTLIQSQQRVYSISGNGVPQPGRYPIPRYDFRLLDAVAVAGGISQFNTSYIYISRNVTGEQPLEAEELGDLKEVETKTKPDTKYDMEREMMEIIAPNVQDNDAVEIDEFVVSAAEFYDDGDFENAADGSVGDDNFALSDEDSRIEWIFEDGKWVPVRIGEPKEDDLEMRKPDESEELFKGKIPDIFGSEAIGRGGTQRRVIKVDAEKLRGGDPRYDILIKPGDSIQVPVDIIGEFSIMGNVNNTGFIGLTGRPMTLKMAIAAAGGLGPLAWPKRCEVIRRIGKKKEEIVMVDLDKIASGEQPDFFIKTNDLINVGTHPTARWRAVLRNSFRATYGFGFLYDRNFADRDFGTSRPIPSFISDIF